MEGEAVSGGEVYQDRRKQHWRATANLDLGEAQSEACVCGESVQRPIASHQADRKGPRGPFSDDEAEAILDAARSQPDALLRWLPWLLAFTGCRIGEVCQATAEDVKQTKSGVWYLYVHLDGPDRTLKTPRSERMVPLHPALVSEGFLDYVRSLPAKSSLFPDVRPDMFGSKGGTATKTHGRWVRRSVGIADTAKDPAHGWRHRFEDQARIAGLPQNVTDALLGHLNPMNESEGYGRGFRFMPDATAPWVAKMASPLCAQS